MNVGEPKNYDPMLLIGLTGADMLRAVEEKKAEEAAAVAKFQAEYGDFLKQKCIEGEMKAKEIAAEAKLEAQCRGHAKKYADRTDETHERRRNPPRKCRGEAPK